MSSRSNGVRVRRATPPVRRAGGGTLLGVFIGLVLGIALAAIVGLYVTGGWKAYQQQVAGNRDSKDSAREPAKSAKSDSGDKPRFDFYKILPGGEEAKGPSSKPPTSDRSLADKAAAPGKAALPPPAGTEKDRDKPAETADTSGSPAAAKADRFWLQAGSFAAESDAENLRARLALAGWEAQLQQGTLPDKATRYRVRLGPYDNVAELNRIKGELARRGFDVAVIKY